MISKRTNPMIGRLSELLVSGNRVSGFLDVGTIPSPRSPLEYRNIPSPKSRDGTKIEFQGGRKNCDLGGVGLGIVAALERSNTCNPEESNGHKSVAKHALFGPNNLNRSDPIPIGIDLDMDSLEDYTYVTSYGPDNKSFTKVYYDPGRKEYNRTSFDGRIDNAISGIKESPAATSFVVNEAAYPTSDFLSCCHLCKKKLQGKDIYMYRGEKAFCSVECRSRQILMDERKEQCRSEVKRSTDVSSSPHATSPIFSAGVLAI